MEREIDGGYKKVAEIKIRGGRGEWAAASISASSFCSVCESLLENIATVSRFPCSFLRLQILASPRPPFKQILCG